MTWPKTPAEPTVSIEPNIPSSLYPASCGTARSSFGARSSAARSMPPGLRIDLTPHPRTGIVFVARHSPTGPTATSERSLNRRGRNDRKAILTICRRVALRSAHRRLREQQQLYHQWLDGHQCACYCLDGRGEQTSDDLNGGAKQAGNLQDSDPRDQRTDHRRHCHQAVRGDLQADSPAGAVAGSECEEQG